MDRPELEAPRSSGPRWRLPAAGTAVLLVIVAVIGLGLTGSRGTMREQTIAQSPSDAASPPVKEVQTARPATASASPVSRPSWVDDLSGQLQCDGPRADLGSEVTVYETPMDPVPTTELALRVVLSPGLYSSLPARGYEPARVEGHWALYRYLVGGHIKAIAVGTDQFGLGSDFGWEIVGVRACDASEFDPDDGLTDDAPYGVMSTNGS